MPRDGAIILSHQIGASVLVFGGEGEKQLPNLLNILFSIEESSTPGPFECRPLELGPFDDVACGLFVDRGQGLEDVLDDRVLDQAGGEDDLVRDDAPAILPNAGIARSPRDAVSTPVVGLHPAIAARDAAAQQTLEQGRPFAGQGPE